MGPLHLFMSAVTVVERKQAIDQNEETATALQETKLSDKGELCHD